MVIASHNSIIYSPIFLPFLLYYPAPRRRPSISIALPTKLFFGLFAAFPHRSKYRVCIIHVTNNILLVWHRFRFYLRKEWKTMWRFFSVMGNSCHLSCHCNEMRQKQKSWNITSQTSKYGCYLIYICQAQTLFEHIVWHVHIRCQVSRERKRTRENSETATHFTLTWANRHGHQSDGYIFTSLARIAYLLIRPIQIKTKYTHLYFAIMEM